MPGSWPDRQRSRSEIGTLVLLTETLSSAKAENAASDPTVMKRSKSTLWGVIMMRCRLLILISVLAIPLSLIAGPAVQAASAQGVSTAVVTPASGLAGSTVTGSGSNWTAGDHIQAYWSDNNSTLGGEVVVAPDGTFTDPGLKIPTGVASGSHQILFSDVEGRYFETASFDVTGTSPSPPPSSCSAPSVSLTPSAGLVGSQFVMKGAGWISGGVVHITLPNGSQGNFGASNATPTVSAGGTWQTTVTVGKSPAGSYTFTFAETGCTSQHGTFQVTASPAPPPTCPPNPTVTFSPNSGPLTTTFTITGSGWVPGGKVTGTLPYGSPGWFTGYQTPTVGANGSFSYKETVNTGPGGPTPPGTYTFTYVEKYGGCSLSFQQKFTVTPKPEYVALGDSYSSGEGNGNYGNSGSCHRSSSAYPNLIEKDVPLIGTLTFVACSGATTADLRSSQLQYVTTTATSVTLTIGGDDVGFADILKRCVYAPGAVGIAKFGSPGCSKDKQFTADVTRKLKDLAASLPGLLMDIQHRAPKAQIFIANYPWLFEYIPADKTCEVGSAHYGVLSEPILIRGDDASWLFDQGSVLSHDIQAAAKSAHVHFVGVFRQFNGHGLCGQSPWIYQINVTVTQLNPLKYTVDSGGMHPTKDGQKAYEQAFLAAENIGG